MEMEKITKNQIECGDKIQGDVSIKEAAGRKVEKRNDGENQAEIDNLVSKLLGEDRTEEQNANTPQDQGTEMPSADDQPITKPILKSSSCKNAWGNSSYADLITTAIMSSPDNRMTLQEIYSWISTNIPYFVDKKDGPTTTGWKNSVRHTLSIRKRFVRVSNSKHDSSNYKSYWTVDPDKEKRKRSRPQRPSSSSMVYTELRNPCDNPEIEGRFLYGMPYLQTYSSRCPYCDWRRDSAVPLSYQQGPSYYSYRYRY